MERERTVINHQAILASAGSGKTFQLAHRYIKLLANKVSPDRIIALTFSRKAAGEIFDSIVKYLCQAASSPDKAQKTGERIGKPNFGQHDFLHLLRVLVESLHRLHISTLDSFTVRVIQSFPMELGIPAHLEMLDNESAQARAARQEVLNKIFGYRYVDKDSQSEFLNAFRQATFGKEEKTLERSLDTFTGEYHGFYQILPTPEAWGERNIIWPEGSPWFDVANDINACADKLESLVKKDDLPPSVAGRWSSFIDAARAFSNSSRWTSDIEYLFKKLTEDIDGLRSGAASIKIDKTLHNLSPEESHLALQLLAHIMRTVLITSLEQTRGIYRFLEQYERFYDSIVRRQGRLTFTDAQYLLTAANSYSGGSVISRIPSQEARLYIDFRLNCKLDHWLLDEFQDTSDLQWEVLGNLADEILQDESGRRSFFYVGDIKQAIYGWRGGNAKLFGKILEQYGQQIERHSMNTSFRSPQPVIDTANFAFGELPPELPQETRKEWAKVWQHHTCQEDIVPSEGYAALLEAKSQDNEAGSADEDRQRVVASLLKEIDPLSRGLSVAILMRTNDGGRKMVNSLRDQCPGMNIVHEGKASIEDNPVVSLLLSLVKLAAHPGDTLALRHLEMSPLAGYFAKENLDNLPVKLLQEIQNSGFQAFIRDWGKRLDAAHPLDGFGLNRLSQLTQAAGEFDESGSRDCNDFLHFIDSYQLHELSSQNAVRVMTVHQSKGLGFDLVILPDLERGNITDAGHTDLTVARDLHSNRPLWALNMPRRIIARTDPILASQVQADNEAHCFDALCTLYVALTRAKRGLYMVTSYPGKNPKAFTSSLFLRKQLASEPNSTNSPSPGGRELEGGGIHPHLNPLPSRERKHIIIGDDEITCLYETGDRNWHTKISQKEERPAYPIELPIDFSKQLSWRQRFVNILPSRRTEITQSAGSLFESSYQERFDFGTAVHELFQRVSWIEDTDIEKLIQEWYQSSRAEEELKYRAIEQFRQALASSEVREALSRPGENVELWSEKRFESVFDNQWVTGAFDRVAIVRNEEGKPLRAILLDFKTDAITQEEQIADAARRYRPQMSLYQRALSQMLGLDSSRIAPQLLFTHPGKVYELG